MKNPKASSLKRYLGKECKLKITILAYWLARATNTMSLRSVAVLASSGGGAATLGHTDPVTLLSVLDGQLQLINARVSAAIYVCLASGKGFDGALDDDEALLYTIEGPDQKCELVERAPLSQINDKVRERQEKLASAIDNNQVDALIALSIHVALFADTLKAAAHKKLALTGSGGNSLSLAANRFGIHLLGNAGGSVATSTFTRAVSYTSALAREWKRPYRPWESTATRPSPISVLNACLPVFWGVCMAKALLCWFGVESMLTELAKTSILPTACATIMANSVRTGHHAPTSSLTMAAALAASTSLETVLGGLLAGFLVAEWTERLLFWCIFHGVPATMTSLLTGGGMGAVVAVILWPVAPWLRHATSVARQVILMTVTLENAWIRACIGGLWGCASCYASKIGGYHSAHLPLILLELEMGDASFLGAVDELTLVLVCAGICCGNLLVNGLDARALTDADVGLSRRGLRINLLYGDFVEACYPFMEQNWVINAGGYAASFASCAWLTLGATSAERLPHSLAYLPLPLSLALAGHHWARYTVSCAIAWSIPLLSTLAAHSLRSRHRND